MTQKKAKEKSWLKRAAAKQPQAQTLELTEGEVKLLSRIRNRHTGLLHFKTAETQHPEETRSLLAKGLIERRGLFYILPPSRSRAASVKPAAAQAQSAVESQKDDVAAVMGGRLRGSTGEAAGEAKPRPSFPPMPRLLSSALQIDQSTPEGKEQWQRLERGLCPNNHEGDELQIDGFRHGVLNLMCGCGFKMSTGINTPTGEIVLAKLSQDCRIDILTDYDNHVASRHRRGRKPR